jgi:hypothetical protein
MVLETMVGRIGLPTVLERLAVVCAWKAEEGKAKGNLADRNRWDRCAQAVTVAAGRAESARGVKLENCN